MLRFKPWFDVCRPIPPWVFRKIQNKQVPEVGDFEPPRKLIGHRKSHIYQRPVVLVTAKYRRVMLFCFLLWKKQKRRDTRLLEIVRANYLKRTGSHPAGGSSGPAH